MTTVFIIAGFDMHATAASEKYTVLKEGLKSKGYSIAASDISWNRRTPSQYSKAFIAFYNKHKSEKNIIIGNSFGAVVAFISAPETRPNAMYLCSLSPFFKEDRGAHPDTYGGTIFGKRRMEDLWSLSADQIADKINNADIKVTVTYGEKECQTSPALVERCAETVQRIKHSQLIELPNAPHSMADESYATALLDLVSL